MPPCEPSTGTSKNSVLNRINKSGIKLKTTSNRIRFAAKRITAVKETS